MVSADTRSDDIGRRLGIHVRKIQIAAADTGAAISRYADDHVAGWVVLAAEGRDGAPCWLRPSLAGREARTVSACTLFVPSHAHGFVDSATDAVALDSVLVPVAHQPRPEPALTIAARLVASFAVPAATVDMLHIAASHAAPPVVAPPVADGVTFAVIRGSGTPAGALVAHARDAQARLVVMATAGRHGLFDGLFDSTTAQVVRQARAPVLAVPAAD